MNFQVQNIFIFQFLNGNDNYCFGIWANFRAPTYASVLCPHIMYTLIPGGYLSSLSYLFTGASLVNPITCRLRNYFTRQNSTLVHRRGLANGCILNMQADNLTHSRQGQIIMTNLNSSELLVMAIVAILILWGLRYFWLMLFASPAPKPAQKTVRYDQYGDTRQRGKGNRSLY
jgi:hypothetical protein